jgi:hypothetical protein
MVWGALNENKECFMFALGAVGAVLNTYRQAIWTSPGNFRNLVARPLDIIGELFEQIKGEEFLPEGVRNLVKAGRVTKDLIGAASILKDPDNIVWKETLDHKVWLKDSKPEHKNTVSAADHKGTWQAWNLARLGTFGWNLYELTNYLGKNSVIPISSNYQGYLNWFGTVSGTTSSVASLYTEWQLQSLLKSQDKKLSDGEIGLSRSKYLFFGSAFALSISYCPLISDRVSETVKLVAKVMNMLGGVGMSYFGSCREPKKPESDKAKTH